jgi:hypothetical protein
MNQSPEEIATIIKIGTSVMLMMASLVIGLVIYFHKKLMKINPKEKTDS